MADQKCVVINIHAYDKVMVRGHTSSHVRKDRSTECTKVAKKVGKKITPKRIVPLDRHQAQTNNVPINFKQLAHTHINNYSSLFNDDDTDNDDENIMFDEQDESTALKMLESNRFKDYATGDGDNPAFKECDRHDGSNGPMEYKMLEPMKFNEFIIGDDDVDHSTIKQSPLIKDKPLVATKRTVNLNANNARPQKQVKKI